jgi:hypothetical protein
MNLLDEQIAESEVQQLLSWRVHVRQIGHDIGFAGMGDAEILRLLHQVTRPTLFTLDKDFADPRLSHPAYGLVYLYVKPEQAAEYVRRVLRHSELNTQAKRMGTYIRASYDGVRVWRRNEPEQAYPWP